jgi:hypothetical protein
VRSILPAFLLLSVVPALAQNGQTVQPVLHLKTRSIVPAAGASVEVVESPVRFGRGHLILQLDRPVSAGALTGWKASIFTFWGPFRITEFLSR